MYILNRAIFAQLNVSFILFHMFNNAASRDEWAFAPLCMLGVPTGWQSPQPDISMKTGQCVQELDGISCIQCAVLEMTYHNFFFLLLHVSTMWG